MGWTNYTFDNVGRLLTFTDNLAGTTNDITWTFSYSPASQVSNWSASSAVYDYKEYATTTVGQTYDGLNRDAGLAAISGGYDLRGNLTSEGIHVTGPTLTPLASRRVSLPMMPRNRFLSAAPVDPPSTVNTTLVYDPEGRLASYTNVDGSGTHVTEFEYDGTDIIAELRPRQRRPAALLCPWPRRRRTGYLVRRLGLHRQALLGAELPVQHHCYDRCLG